MESAQDERLAAPRPGQELAPPLTSRTIPGGKALLRLLHLLDSRGYEGLASAVVDAAVPDQVQDQFYARAEKFMSPARRIAPF